MCGFNAVTSIKLSFIIFVILSRFGTMPWTQFFVNTEAESPNSLADLKVLATMTGLNTFSSKWPLLPPIDVATLLPITWQHTIVIASHCVGFTLPGMMELPGSFSGSDNSPRPHLGPLPRNLMSFAT